MIPSVPRTPPAQHETAPLTSAAGVRAIARWRDPASLVVVATALVAAGLQVFVLTRPHELLAGWSDISIYLGAAIRLVHGALPYRDFALLQPPGLVLLLSPFGLFSLAVGSRVALMALTACTPLLAAADVALVGRLIAHRGWRAALVACGSMAVYPATYLALQDSLVEPLMCLFCLLGAVLVFERDGLSGRRRLALGGAAFGFAASVLIASALPVLVVAALCASRLRRRLLPFLGGVAAGFLIPAAPFFAAAPAAFLHDTVVTQLERVPLAGRTPVATRLMDMTFAVYGGRVAGAVAALALIAGVILVGLAVGRRRLTALDGFAIGGTLTLGVAQFAISDYFVHFPAMLVPYPALLLGIAVARLRWGWTQQLVAAVAVVALAGLAVAQAALIETEFDRGRRPVGRRGGAGERLLHIPVHVCPGDERPHPIARGRLHPVHRPAGHPTGQPGEPGRSAARVPECPGTHRLPGADHEPPPVVERTVRAALCVRGRQLPGAPLRPAHHLRPRRLPDWIGESAPSGRHRPWWPVESLAQPAAPPAPRESELHP